jgi:hypothetical protein
MGTPILSEKNIRFHRRTRIWSTHIESGRDQRSHWHCHSNDPRAFVRRQRRTIRYFQERRTGNTRRRSRTVQRNGCNDQQRGDRRDP